MSRLLRSDELARFRSLTDNYQPNPVVIDSFKTSKFAIIAGPSGAGKDTLRNALLTTYPEYYQAVLSTTTRPMREGEQDGVDYHFRTVEDVAKSLERREFFKAALVHNQQISCLHIDEVAQLKPNQTGLSILIVQTEQQLSKLKEDIRTIFIIPPDIQALRKRLSQERPLSNDEIDRRTSASVPELQIALERSDYYCLVSDDISLLTKQAHDFLQNGEREKQADINARNIIQTILNRLSI